MCFDYCKEELKSVTKSSRSHLYKLLIAAANCEKSKISPPLLEI